MSKQLNLYLISRKDEPEDYDIYISALVVAYSPAEALYVHPSGNCEVPVWSEEWVDLNQLEVELINQLKVELVGVCTNLNYKASDVVITNYKAG